MAVKTFFIWLFSRKDREPKAKDAADKLRVSARVTAKCRYNASIRLHYQGKFAFFTTTVLSLGLIFIPLLQNSGINLSFKPNVLNMMQIFLAVSVLVYSVVIGTARYDIRADKLNECGNKLKELIRGINAIRDANGQYTQQDLDKYQGRYSDIMTDTENHIRSDYRLAILEMNNDYIITGLPRLWNFFVAYAEMSIAYIVPIIMIAIEVIFISDMVNRTTILVNYLNGTAVVH